MIPILPSGFVSHNHFDIYTLASSAPSNLDTVIDAMSLIELQDTIVGLLEALEDEDGALVLFRRFLKEAGAQHPRAVRKAAAEASDYVEDKLISMRHADIRMRSAGLDKNALPADVRELIRVMLY